MTLPTIRSCDLKPTREALCAAMSALLEHARNGLDVYATPVRVARLQEIVDQIDRARPLGPDGKHGDRHTPICGCER